MTSFIVIGNCQTVTLQFLMEKMVPEARVEIVDVSDPQSRSPENIQRLIPLVLNADFIFCQPTILAEEVLSTLTKLAGPKLVRIADLYFRGLHPDLCCLGTHDKRSRNPSLYHSVIILDAFKTGLSEQKALQGFNEDNFKRLGLWDAWDTSLEQLQLRDQKNDVPVADLVDVYCRETRGFLNIHHPSLSLMQEYLARILNFIGVKFQTIDTAACQDPLEELDILPVLDLVADHNQLAYRTTQNWLLGYPGRRYKSLTDVITAFYECYRQSDPLQLYIHSPHDMAASLKSVPTLKHLTDAKARPALTLINRIKDKLS